MDSLTQAVLGAGIGGAMLGRFHGRKAVAAGALLATLPDLDVLIRHGDPLSAMVNHRGFSHSLIVLTAISALLTALCRLGRSARPYPAWYLFATLWLVLATHPLLDAFTSYGTQLWWPYRPVPTAWSSIFIIDPLFTLPLLAATLAALGTGLTPRVVRGCRWALAWAAIYLALSLVAKHVVEDRVQRTLAAEGLQVESMFSAPEPFTILLWRVAAKVAPSETPKDAEDGPYVEAVAGLFDAGPPEHVRLMLNTSLNRSIDSRALQDLRWFTGDWLRYDVYDGDLVVTDLRMGLGPGYYSFRFHIAERGEDTTWQSVTPTTWPRGQTRDALVLALRRIAGPRPPLPLAQWESRMERAP